MSPPIRPESTAVGAPAPSPAPPPTDVVAEMRAALQAAREAGASDDQMDFLLRAWTREVTNVNEADALRAEQESAAAGTFGSRAASALAALVKDVPGVEAVQAGVRSVARDQPYAEALGDVREGYENLNRATRIPLRVLGGGMAAASLPIKSPAYAGAAYGGLLNALSADPDQSPAERVGRTTLGAVVGGAAGKLGDVVATGVRARFAEPLGKAIERLKGAREDASAPLYDFALAQGAAGGTATPKVAAFLARPDVTDIVAGLRQLDEFAGVAPDDPRMLDAIYKVLSDQQRTVGKQLAVTEPGKPNLGRFTERQIRGVKAQALDALDDPMSMYRPATAAFAEGSKRIKAVERGAKAAAVESGSGSAPEHLAKFGRPALLDFLKGAGPEVADEAATGVLGFGQRKLEQAGATGLLNPMRGMARNFLLDGGDLLRAIEGTAGTKAADPLTRATLLDYLKRAGTTAATPNFGSF